MEFEVPKSLVVIVIVKFEVLSKSPISGLIFRPTLSIVMVQIFLEWSVVVIRGTMYGGAQEELRSSEELVKRRCQVKGDCSSRQLGNAMGASGMRQWPGESNGSLENEALPKGTQWEPWEWGNTHGNVMGASWTRKGPGNLKQPKRGFCRDCINTSH